MFGVLAGRTGEKMKIVKQSISVMQNLQFATIKEMDEYIVITYPLDCYIEIKGNFVHIRKNK